MFKNLVCHIAALAILLTIQLEHASAQRCPLRWTMYGQSCYLYQFNDLKSWPAARNWCRSQGGDLVKFETTRERTWVLGQLNNLQSHQHAPPTWWIGLNDLDATSAWQWADRSPVDSRIYLWSPGNPNNQGAKEHCVRMEALKMNDRPCYQMTSYVCERSRGLPLTCDADTGWQSYSPYCYKVRADQQTWPNAQKQCRSDGGDLVSINSRTDENTMLSIARIFKRPYWIGLHSLQHANSVQWVWSNGSLLGSSASYWVNGRSTPPNNAKNTTCVYISNTITNNKPWQMTSCTARKFYACRKPEGVCQPGWVPHQTKCYQMNIQFKYTWSHAKTYCDSQGAKLMELYRNSDTQFLNSYLHELAEAGIDSFWIGASDQNGTTFKWSHSNAITYQKWQHSPPVNTPNKLDCSYVATNDRRGMWRTTSDCVLMQKAFVCSIPMNQPVKHVTTPRPQYTCPTNWLLYGNNCYRFMDHRRNWLAAGTDCQKQKAQLAKITDAHVQSFVMSHTHNQEYWIGLNDEHQEGRYIWASDNSISHYFNWNPHEPNNQGDENCVETRGSGWNDKACTTGLKYICQKIAPNAGLPSGLASTTALPYSIKCGLLWEEDPNTDYCYQFHDQQLSWNDAQSTCRQQGGHLASIASREEQFYIAGRIHTMSSISLSIGANDKGREGGWTWSDRSPFKYFNWAPGQPNDFKHNEDCAVIFTQKGTWDDSPCTHRNGYICKKLGRVSTTIKPSTTIHVPAGMVLGCRSGWSPHGSSCYQFIEANLNWVSAQTLCRTHGGFLASIGSQADQNYVMTLLPRGGAYWIGLNDRTVQNNYVWSDGTPVTYTHWGTREPNNFRGQNEDCVYIAGGIWNDAVCSNPANGVVCKTPKQIVSSTQSPQSIGCTYPAVGYQSYCYKFVTSAMKTWSDANKDCTAHSHGQLATVNDRFTQAVVANYLSNKGDKFWIGMSDSVTPGTYQWKDGTQVGFTFWRSSHTGNERNTCVALRTSIPVGLWESKACNESHHYVCQSPRQGYTTPPPTTTYRPLVCPANWSSSSQNDSYCYKVYYHESTLGKMTWMEARDYCRSLGGDLPSAHSLTQTTYLKSLIGYHYEVFWIGLNDRDTEAGYVWSDGTGTDYTNWNPNEPNNDLGDEDCVHLTTTGGWNDNNCYLSANWICAVRRGTILQTTVSPPTGVTSSLCDPGWTYYNGSCYESSPSSGDSALLNWYDAGRYCVGKGASLASIHSLDENHFLYSMISRASISDAWIGYNQLSSTSYSWTDGSLVDFDMWNSGEPNDGYGGELCVNFAWGRTGWNDNNCGEQMAFVCKKTLGAHGPPTIPPVQVINGGCPFSFLPVPHSNKCFRLEGLANQLNWTMGQQACRYYGRDYDIAAINTATDQAFAVTLLKGVTSNVWIGLNNQRHNSKFLWTDNSPFSYSNWATNEPNGHSNANHVHGLKWTTQRWTWLPQQPTTENADCVEMYAGYQTGKWNDQKCITAKPYLCQGKRVPHLPAPNPQGSCRRGYQQYESACYKMVTSPATWSAANMACNRDHGSLVNINDIYEDSFVFSVMSSQSYWIGLSDNSSLHTDSYTWTQHWPVTYTNWGSGEPTRGTGEGCVAVMGGMWNDTVCSTTMAYVCEINPLDRTTTPPPMAAVVGHCPSSSNALYGSSCYLIEPFRTTTWPQARYICQKYGMKLASIHTAEEEFVIISTANSMKPLSNSSWVTRHKGAQNMWIGMNKGLSDGFSWTDNTAVNYLNWNDGEPSDALGSTLEECVELYILTGKWNDNACSNSKGYICKIPASISTTPMPHVTRSSVPVNPQGTTPNPSIPVNPTARFQPSRLVTRFHPSKPVTPNNPYPTFPPFQTFKPGSRQKQQHPAPNPSSSNLSGGAVAGIIIAVLVVLGAGAAAAVLIKRRNGGVRDANGSESQGLGFENALYSKTHQSVNIDPRSSNGTVMTSGLPGEDDA